MTNKNQKPAGNPGAEKTVLEAIRHFGMVKSGDSILISISGGPDSTFLTHILYGLRDEFNLTLYGYCLDHITRGGRSALDAAFVKKLCRKLDIRLFSEKTNVRKWCRTSRLSFQAGARKLRKSRLEEISRKCNITKIAVGHNSDDNIETFLMRLIRGAGARGLSGIKPVSGKVIRPLITTSRTDIMQYIEDKGIQYCVDHTNLENVYFRNRVRNKLIPFISEKTEEMIWLAARLAGIFSWGRLDKKTSSIWVARVITGSKTKRMSSSSSKKRILTWLSLTCWKRVCPIT